MVARRVISDKSISHRKTSIPKVIIQFCSCSVMRLFARMLIMTITVSSLVLCRPQDDGSKDKKTAVSKGVVFIGESPFPWYLILLFVVIAILLTLYLFWGMICECWAMCCWPCYCKPR